MADLLDPGMARFAGRNVVPQRSSLTEDSGCVDPKPCVGPMDRRHRAWSDLEADRGGAGSFDPDIRTVPGGGRTRKHPSSGPAPPWRNRRRKGVLVSFARAAARRLVYADARVRTVAPNDGGLRFIGFREERNDGLPKEPVFGSRRTTHANLQRIHEKGIEFLAVRGALDRCATPSPMRSTSSHGRADRRSSDEDRSRPPPPPLRANGRYRLPAVRVGNGRQNANSAPGFRNFVKAPADLTIGQDGIDVRIGRRATPRSSATLPTTRNRHRRAGARELQAADPLPGSGAQGFRGPHPVWPSGIEARHGIGTARHRRPARHSRGLRCADAPAPGRPVRRPPRQRHRSPPFPRR